MMNVLSEVRGSYERVQFFYGVKEGLLNLFDGTFSTRKLFGRDETTKVVSSM